jgi:5-methyltetrahydropteroyltriglutamate--homocysteine methyltransferase
MRTSTERILTTHTGSLPRPLHLRELYSRGAMSEVNAALGEAVRDVVRQQRDVGLDIVNDGEFGKPVHGTGDADHAHGAWAMYVQERVDGFADVEVESERQSSSKDRSAFPNYYGEGPSRRPGQLGDTETPAAKGSTWACVGPIRFHGQEIVARDIANLKAALDGGDPASAFLPAVSPACVTYNFPNQHYRDDDEYRLDLAEALREEYLAITNAGFVLQIDDPVLVAGWDFWDGDDLDAYRSMVTRDVELLNHALRGIPESQIRYHLCWGSWNGPHCSDLPLRSVVDLMLQVNVSGYVLEAANPRHEHEWKIWRDVELPDGKVLIPGVVTHKTPVLEHPEVAADRIVRYAELVGRERVIAGTDCGVGGRVASDVAWAKLRVLSEAARLATDALWSAAGAIHQ